MIKTPQRPFYHKPLSEPTDIMIEQRLQEQRDNPSNRPTDNKMYFKKKTENVEMRAQTSGLLVSKPFFAVPRTIFRYIC